MEIYKQQTYKKNKYIYTQTYIKSVYIHIYLQNKIIIINKIYK